MVKKSQKKKIDKKGGKTGVTDNEFYDEMDENLDNDDDENIDKAYTEDKFNSLDTTFDSTDDNEENQDNDDNVVDLNSLDSRFLLDNNERNFFTIDNEFVGESPERIYSKKYIKNNDGLAPDLLSLQFKSFYNLLPFGAYRKKRSDELLYRLIKSFFPVKSIKDEFILDFIDYKIEPPKYSPAECLKRGVSYAVSLILKFRLISSDGVLEQDVYFGDIPYVTKSGSFIYNGIERVGVMQIEKSTGVSFTNNKKSGFSPLDCVCRIIPQVGVWIEFVINQKMQMSVAFNKKSKVFVSTFLRALGYKSAYDLFNIFGLVDEIDCTNPEELEKAKGKKLAYRVLKNNGEEKSFVIKKSNLLIASMTVIDDDVIKKIVNNGDKSILVFKVKQKVIDEYMIFINTINADSVETEEDALFAIYKACLNDFSTNDILVARKFFYNLIENPNTFNLGIVGRKRINDILGKKKKTLKYEGALSMVDVKGILSYFFDVINKKKEIVDIDHYGNKQLKTIGEKLYEMFRISFQRISRIAKERMNVCDRADMNIYNLINCSILSVSINSFFATNPLLQFMDSINPLCEIMHKRRISAGGDGGIDENSTSTEIRDIHYSQYGRICPVETPESSSIGIISSLAMHAKTDRYGFILSPYRVVTNAKVDLDNNNIVYLSASDELGKKIIPANTPIDKDGNILVDLVKARMSDDFKLVDKNEVDYMDVVSNQPFSVAASVIPFLENDDSSRALTGVNMLKQAVPLLVPEAPIVGTGVERKVCQDSRTIIYAEGDGVVKYVDANKIIIDYDITEDEDDCYYDRKLRTYNLTKFVGTNQKTCKNYKPIVKEGQKVHKGTVLVEGFSTKEGELALGKNIKVAFVTCNGYNFQDSIVISERLLKDDVFTSICIEKFVVCTKSTKFGNEEMIRDVYTLTADKKKNLDENGIVKEGVFVNSGDILVGKAKPRVDNYITSESKLLRAIFGEKSCEMLDNSLVVPPFTKGTVINTKLYNRRVAKKTAKTLKEEIAVLKKRYNQELDAFTKVAISKFVKILNNVVSAGVFHKYGEILINKGEKFTERNLRDNVLLIGGDVDSTNIEYSNLNYFTSLEDTIADDWTEDEHINNKILKLIDNTLEKQNEILHRYYSEEYKILHGDYLVDEVLKKAEVTIANKRKLQIGDKLSGRHGNKGVISKILKEEDMPFLEDGTRVDMVLTPLGIPSRMNIGQVFETLLGWAGEKLGCKYATPIFSGFDLDSINGELNKAGLPDCAEVQLYDGLTGEKFEQKSTVGMIYMIKLNHMVADKVHARSIGQYSVITQQPLSGRAHFGGQRFGEMEVWSLEAYGAANLLQEMLTIKSDDIIGRKKAYEALLNGEPVYNSNVPESFHVLMKELTAIGLRITFSN